MTVLFFIVLKLYKQNIEIKDGRKKRKSNFIYVLFVPLILYLAYFTFVSDHKGSGDNPPIGSLQPAPASSSSSSLMNAPYPDSSPSL